jgi:hypothetical protein
VEAENRRKKDKLGAEYQHLDVISETRSLTNSERTRIKEVSEELNKISDREETKGRQRGRERDIEEGDRNTKYFHAVASQRSRKTTLFSLDGPDGAVETNEGMLDVTTKYYKKIFKFEPRPEMNIFNEFFSREEKVSREELEILESRFTETKIKKAVFDSYPDGALALMGFLLGFIKKFGIL